MDLGIHFLKDVGLIRSKVTCNTCSRDMTWSGLGPVLKRDRARVHGGLFPEDLRSQQDRRDRESNFGRRKYRRGQPVKGKWVFGGVERESGKTFLVPVADRTADNLMAVTDAWIEPGTRSSVIAGVRTTISKRKVTHTAPSTIT
jgi:hypothetical protein